MTTGAGRLEAIWIKRFKRGPMDAALPGLREAMYPSWGGGAFGEVLDDASIAVGDEVCWEE